MKTLLVFIFSFVTASSVSAQATRTWISGVGDDVNPCSRTAPCKTWAGAISKTAAGGEINALDPGGYGALTITKAITIDGGGTFASALGAGTNGFVISAAATDKVILRNLAVNGASTGINGVRILKARSVRLENVTIFGFSQRGIDIQPSGDAVSVSVVNSSITNNAGVGVVAQGSGTGLVSLHITGSTIAGNLSHGIWIASANKASVFNSSVHGNGLAGLITTGNDTRVSVHSCTFSNNGTGIQAGNGIAETTFISLSNTQVAANTTGTNAAGGTIESHVNNAVRNNTTNIVGTLFSLGPQ